MIDGKKMLGCKGFTPIAVVNASFAIYFIPLMLVILSGEDLVESVNPRYLSYPFLVIIINIISLFMMNLICLSASSMSFRIAPISTFQTKIKALVISFYILLSFGSIAYLELRLEIAELARLLIQDPLMYLVEQRQVGINLNGGGLLKYYFLSHLSFVTIYICMKLIGSRNKFISYFLAMVYFGLLVFFYFLSRREAIIFGCLVVFFSYRDFFRGFKAVFLLFVLLIIFLITINIRNGSDSLFGVMGFVLSQEFYPFQAGAVLVDEWIRRPSYNSLLEITPAMFFVPEFETLSSRSMYEEFGLQGPGPTVGIVYAIVKYAVFGPLVVFSIAVFIGSTIYQNATAEKNGWVWIPLYSFFVLKLFLLVRNGEFANFFIDISIFIIFYMPILIFFQNANKKTAYG